MKQRLFMVYVWNIWRKSLKCLSLVCDTMNPRVTKKTRDRDIQGHQPMIAGSGHWHGYKHTHNIQRFWLLECNTLYPLHGWCLDASMSRDYTLRWGLSYRVRRALDISCNVYCWAKWESLVLSESYFCVLAPSYWIL